MINALELLYLVKFQMGPLLLVVQKNTAVVLNFVEICWFVPENKKVCWKKSAHRYLIEIEKQLYEKADYSF